MTSDGSADIMLQAARDALWACALAAWPILLPILIVGLVVGIIQAATSVNEATLSFVPKLIATGVMLALCGGMILATLTGLVARMIGMIAVVVR